MHPKLLHFWSEYHHLHRDDVNSVHPIDVNRKRPLSQEVCFIFLTFLPLCCKGIMTWFPAQHEFRSGTLTKYSKWLKYLAERDLVPIVFQIPLNEQLWMKWPPPCFLVISEMERSTENLSNIRQNTADEDGPGDADKTYLKYMFQ
jgi:hypothetical protein